MKFSAALLPGLALVALAACSTPTPTESAAVSACRGAVSAQTTGDLTVTTEAPSIEGTTVVLQPTDGGIPWQCNVSDSGQVLSVDPGI